MSNNRDFIVLRPLGTCPVLRCFPGPSLRRYRARWTFMAEVTRNDDPEWPFRWSWLVRNKETGTYMALGIDHGTEALPQRKVAVALVNLGHTHPDGIKRARDVAET